MKPRLTPCRLRFVRPQARPWSSGARTEAEATDLEQTGNAVRRGLLIVGPSLYETFRDKKDGCVKVVFDLS